MSEKETVYNVVLEKTPKSSWVQVLRVWAKMDEKDAQNIINKGINRQYSQDSEPLVVYSETDRQEADKVSRDLNSMLEGQVTKVVEA